MRRFNEVTLEDYDMHAGNGDGEGEGGGGAGGGEAAADEEQVMHEFEPLPLDEDMEDANGVPGSVVAPGSAAGGGGGGGSVGGGSEFGGGGGGGGGVQFQTPGVQFETHSHAPLTPGAHPPGTGSERSAGVVLEFGKTAQKTRRDPDQAGPAAGYMGCIGGVLGVHRGRIGVV